MRSAKRFPFAPKLIKLFNKRSRFLRLKRQSRKFTLSGIPFHSPNKFYDTGRRPSILR